MAYGFKLGQIEGLDSSIEKVNLTITGTSTASYVLNYGNEGGDEGWTDNVENPNFTLHYHLELDEYVLIAFNMDESDVGNEYTINLSLPEEPTQAFTEAVGMATEAEIITIPAEYSQISASVLTNYMSGVITADGKTCVLPQPATWSYSSAEDKDDYLKLRQSIKRAATNLNINAYCIDMSSIYARYAVKTRGYDAAGNAWWIGFEYTLYYSGLWIKFDCTIENYDNASGEPSQMQTKFMATLLTELSDE